MHPAFSVIFFTTASGAGYGLLILLAGFAAAGLLPADFWLGIVGFGLSLGLVTLGLLASTFHLGHPERAWRAFSQWRTSWLSREGVASVATYGPALGFAIGWICYGSTAGWWTLVGLLAALAALATLICTGMIYASLPTIQRWHNGWVVPNYLALGVMTGALLLGFLVRAFGLAADGTTTATVVLILVAALLKLGYWRFIDRSRATSTPASATGLGAAGTVRLLEAPHTEENYLMREMGYRIARKHAFKLRRIALVAGFALPLALTLLALLADRWGGTLLGLVAVLSAALGVVVERWLFFAEARHVVTLYYGADRA